MNKLIFILTLFLSVSSHSLFAQDSNFEEFKITKIIIPYYASTLELKTAFVLSRYFKKITGIQYKVEKESNIETLNCVYVGKTNFSLSRGFVDSAKYLIKNGFIIKTVNQAVVIVGRDDLGTLFGGYELLEYFGVRWFMPGDIGEAIPSQSEIKINEGLNLIEEPAFQIRNIGRGNEWSMRNKMNVNIPGVFDEDVNIWGGFHTFGALLPPSVYFDSHPEWFPLINGVRRKFNPAYGPVEGQTYNNQISLVNAWQKISEVMIDILDRNQQTDIITLAPNDGGGFSEEAEERAWDDIGDVPWDQTYSRRLLIFYNKVAEKIKLSHPGKIVRVGAYWKYTRPPKDISIVPMDNIHIYLTHYGYCESHPINEITGPNKDFFEIMKMWKERLNNRNAVEIYEYYYKVAWYDLPWPLYKKISIDIPILKNLGVVGFYSQYSKKNAWTLLLNYYTAAKFLWNPEIKIDSLLNDFYDRFYGTASAPMKKFYETLYNGFYTASDHIDGYAVKAVPLYTLSVTSQCKAFLQDAKLLAKGDSLIIKRISFADASVEYTEKLINFLRLKKLSDAYSGNSFQEKLKLYGDANSAGQELKNFMNNNKQFLESGVIDVSSLLNDGKYYLGKDILSVENEWKKLSNVRQVWQLKMRAPLSLFSVDFIDSASGWIAGDGGVILHTDDKGESWSAQNSQVQDRLWNIGFVDRRKGYAVGNGGSVLRTIDGGNEWIPQTVKPGTTWRGISFIDSLNVWISGYNSTEGGVAAHSTDGGISWNSQVTDYKDEVYHSIIFTDKKNGCLVGSGGTILITTNGGETWFDKSSESATKNRLFDVEATPNLSLFAVGTGGTIIKSADNGNSWSTMNNSISATVMAVDFVSDDKGWISGGKGEIFSTTDGGGTWELQISDSNISENLRDIDFVNNSYGWAVGEGGAILKFTGNSNVSQIKTGSLNQKFFLFQNYPNPFNPATTIIYNIPKTSNVTLKIYDLLGNETAVLISEIQRAGIHKIKFSGEDFSSGIYLYQINAGDYTETKKMILLK